MQRQLGGSSHITEDWIFSGQSEMHQDSTNRKQVKKSKPNKKEHEAKIQLAQGTP
jgi:hypothetical protein